MGHFLFHIPTETEQAGTAVAVRGLPGAAGGRLVTASYAGAALVLAVATQA